MVVGGNGLAYTEYVFDVTAVIKGNVDDPLIVRQVNLGREPPDGGEVTPQPVPRNPLPLPEYQLGQEVVLFLTEESTLGLTSPLGMQQGVFDVQTLRGKKFVSSRFSNITLLRGISADSRFPPKGAETLTGPFQYDSFVSLVKELSGTP